MVYLKLIVGAGQDCPAAQAALRKGVGLSLKRFIKGTGFSVVAALERSLRTKRSGDELASFRNILVLQHATALGTVVHATPLIPALKEAMPDCRIAVAASGFALEVLRNNPGIEWLIETPSPLRDWRGAAATLRKTNPFRGEDFSILTPVGNERTKIVTQTLFAGAGARVGFTQVPALYRAAFEFDYGKSQIDNNLSIVAALGHQVRHFEPQMFFGAEELNWAERMLVESGVAAGQMVAAFVTQTSVTQRKSWRKERFQAAAESLVQRYGAHIVFVGTASEAAAIDDLRKGIAHPTSSFAGKTNLLQMAALLSLCDVGLTLDTGTLHVGRTVGLPMAIIAPAWSPPLEWLPLNNPRYRILKNAEMVDCPPDYIIDEVSVDEVTSALQELLEEFPPGQRRSS
jgi:ADP-heptose:LPS heptosyltransferase